jgi:hypothetical protein
LVENFIAVLQSSCIADVYSDPVYSSAVSNMSAYIGILRSIVDKYETDKEFVKK